MKGKLWIISSVIFTWYLAVISTAYSGPQATMKTTTSPSAASFHVFGSSSETNTGYTVSLGDQIQFIAVGSVNTYPDATNPPNPWSGPDGNGYNCNAQCLLPSAQFGALIGRIGSGNWFLIGSRKSLTVSTSGELILAVNDNINNDNLGSYTISLNPTFFYEDFDNINLGQ